MRGRRRLLVAAAALIALSMSAIASADNIQNSGVDSSGVVTVVPGGSVSIAWRIHETGSDGCAPANGAPTIVSIAPSGPIIASDATLTFTSCDSWQSVTFTVAGGASPGDYPVTATPVDADDQIDGSAPAIIRVQCPTRHRPS